MHLRYTQRSLDALRGLGGGPASTSTYDARGRGTYPGTKPIVAG